MYCWLKGQLAGSSPCLKVWERWARVLNIEWPMCRMSPFLARSPFVLALAHSHSRYPPCKLGNRSHHFSSMPNSLHCADPRVEGRAHHVIPMSPNAQGTRRALNPSPSRKGTSTLRPAPCSHQPHCTPRQSWAHPEDWEGPPAAPRPRGSSEETEPLPETRGCPAALRPGPTGCPCLRRAAQTPASASAGPGKKAHSGLAADNRL